MYEIDSTHILFICSICDKNEIEKKKRSNSKNRMVSVVGNSLIVKEKNRRTIIIIYSE